MKISLKIFAVGMSFMLALSFVACSKKQAATNAPAASATTGGSIDKSKPLIVYTNSGSNGRGDWLKEKAAAAGYNIEYVQIKAAELTNRIIAEKNNPQADLVFGLNSLEYEKLKKENILDKWRPTWADEVDLSLGDKEGYYYPIVIQPLVNMMNADLKNPPKDYTELIKPEWKNKYIILPFSGGTGKTILSSLLIRYRDEKGEHGVSKEGWNFIKNWIANGHYQESGEDSPGLVISGEIPISEMWGSGVLQYQNERNYKFQIMVPDVGCPYVTEQVGMIHGSKNRDLAVDFANWFGSAEIQEAWMNQFGTIPCHPKAIVNAPEDIKEFMSLVHPQPMDWEYIGARIEQWIEKCELEYRQ